VATQTDILHEAKRLLDAGRYDEARSALSPIAKHPKAKEWLAKLDARYPRKPNKARRLLLVLLVAVIIGGAVIFAKFNAELASGSRLICEQMQSTTSRDMHCAEQYP